MKIRQIAVATLFLSALGFTDTAHAGDSTTVKATGQAAIMQDDVAMARDRAIEDGLRKAVEQAVGTMISSESVTENFQLISDKILSQSKGYVQNYKVLSESKDNGVFIAKLEATVSKGNLQGDLDGIMHILRAKNLPRILIMVAEQNINQSGLSYWWDEGGKGSVSSTDLGVVENSFIDQWTKKGLRFVDRQALAGKLQTSAAVATSATPNPDAIKAFAGNSGADVVVIGKAVANDAGDVMGTKMRSVRANASLRALDLDTGSILATATESGASAHIDPTTGGTKALEKVSRKAADSLLKDILNKWQKDNSSGGTVTIKFSGMKKRRMVKQIQSHLRNNVRGVSDVRTRSYKSKVAQIEVDFKGSVEDLAIELEEKKFKGFSIEIDETTTNTIAATVR